jgi:hypothetical protein
VPAKLGVPIDNLIDHAAQLGYGGALKLGRDPPREIKLRASGCGKAIRDVGPSNQLRKPRPEEEHRAAIVTAADAAPHALFEPLQLPGDHRFAVAERDSLAAFDPVISERQAVNDQQAARFVGKVYAVVTVHDHH